MHTQLNKLIEDMPFYSALCEKITNIPSVTVIAFFQRAYVFNNSFYCRVCKGRNQYSDTENWIHCNYALSRSQHRCRKGFVSEVEHRLQAWKLKIAHLPNKQLVN